MRIHMFTTSITGTLIRQTTRQVSHILTRTFTSRSSTPTYIFQTFITGIRIRRLRLTRNPEQLDFRGYDFCASVTHSSAFTMATRPFLLRGRTGISVVRPAARVAQRRNDADARGSCGHGPAPRARRVRLRRVRRSRNPRFGQYRTLPRSDVFKSTGADRFNCRHVWRIDVADTHAVPGPSSNSLIRQ